MKRNYITLAGSWDTCKWVYGRKFMGTKRLFLILDESGNKFYFYDCYGEGLI